MTVVQTVEKCTNFSHELLHAGLTRNRELHGHAAFAHDACDAIFSPAAL